MHCQHHFDRFMQAITIDGPVRSSDAIRHFAPPNLKRIQGLLHDGPRQEPRRRNYPVLDVKLANGLLSRLPLDSTGRAEGTGGDLPVRRLQELVFAIEQVYAHATPKLKPRLEGLKALAAAAKDDLGI